MTFSLVGDYAIGSIIGQGSSAVVHQAWHRETGAFVAIKRFERGSNNLKSVLTELELLGKLDHPHIVKYLGAINGSEGHLHVVLEYMENGSLASVRKLFGNFSELVCASYVRQVLLGLQYLHAQGVLHLDIKGANILTTKTGVAKVADFGVAARVASFGGTDLDDGVVGSPYWMAPEIIEMSAPPSAACDIWSLACTVIELTTGEPPYFDLAPMSALFRIVQDGIPRLPAGGSEALLDFLLKCFNREAALRADARALLNHAWLQRAPVPSEVDTLLKNSIEHDLNQSQQDASLGLQRTQDQKMQDGTQVDFACEERPSPNSLLLHSTNPNARNFSQSAQPTDMEDARSKIQLLKKYREADDDADDGFCLCKSEEAYDATLNLGFALASYNHGDKLSSACHVSDKQRSHDEDLDKDEDADFGDLEDDIYSDPFNGGFLEDNRDVIHDDRDREAKKQIDILLFEFAMPMSRNLRPNSSRLLDLLDPNADIGEKTLSELSAVSLIEALRCPFCIEEVLQVTHGVLFAYKNAADTLSCMGIAALLLALIPAKNNNILKQLGAILSIFRLRCSDANFWAFIFSGGLQLALELLVIPKNRNQPCVRSTVALIGAKCLVRALDAKTSRIQMQGPSRIALCRALALREAPAKLAACLEASLDLDVPQNRDMSEASSCALAALCDADTVVKEIVAAPLTATTILRVLAAFPCRVADAWRRGFNGDAEAKLAVRLLKSLKAISMTSAAALDSLEKCDAIEAVVCILRVAQTGVMETSTMSQKPVPRQDELEDHLVPTVYYLCHIDRSRLARAARCGAASLLATCVARRRHLKQFALALLCELCHVAASDGQGDIRAELWYAGGVRLYIHLFVESYWCVRALSALSSWLKADSQVEAAMTEPGCAHSIVLLFRRLDRADFEQALVPLLDACEASPCFVRGLLSVCIESQDHTFILEIGRQLERQTSAITRKTLLGILRVTLAAANAPRILLLGTNIDNVLISLLTDDAIRDQILVLDLAAQLLRISCVD